MEKYQRNIFGFQKKFNIKSFEYLVTIFLTFLTLILTVFYISWKIVEIESGKLDILRSNSIVQSYQEIGQINLLKESKLMPVVDIRANNIEKVK